MSKAQEGTNQNVRVWWRDEFKCAYCDLDMSSGRKTELLVSDHIDPRTKIQYPPGDFGEQYDLEKTTACIPCNSYKHRFLPPANCSRAEKIKAGRGHVRKKRKEDFEWFRKVKEGLI